MRLLGSLSCCPETAAAVYPLLYTWFFTAALSHDAMKPFSKWHFGLKCFSGSPVCL